VKPSPAGTGSSGSVLVAVADPAFAIPAVIVNTTANNSTDNPSIANTGFIFFIFTIFL
jgi:mevalonate kinase